MKIKLYKNKTYIVNRDNEEYTFNLGEKDIQEHGFQVVDHLVESILQYLKNKEEIFVEGTGLQSRMIGRKLEDKVKRDIVYIDENKTVYL
ncbi:MAG: hypothetical protein QG614_438 [Patescibacteria group bacterium]|nr:hypothetical protein [Patescibacteria group bacterium]